MSDDDIKQIFFHCDNNDTESLYSDVDIIEFGRKLCAFATMQEYRRCLAIVTQHSNAASSALKSAEPTFEWRNK